jgi:excisionase family DNA binding protein
VKKSNVVEVVRLRAHGLRGPAIAAKLGITPQAVYGALSRHRQATSPSGAPAPRCLTVEQAADYLGAHVHAIRRLVWNKEIAHFRLGHRILFDISDLDRYVENQKSAARG